jgi:hypothetical protein
MDTEEQPRYHAPPEEGIGLFIAPTSRLSYYEFAGSRTDLGHIFRLLQVPITT